MTNQMTLDAARNPTAFLNEIAKSNGTDSTQYVWALAVVREIKNELKKMER